MGADKQLSASCQQAAPHGKGSAADCSRDKGQTLSRRPSPVPSLSGPQGRSRDPRGTKPCRVVTVTIAGLSQTLGRARLRPYSRFHKALRLRFLPCTCSQASQNPRARLLPETTQAVQVDVTCGIRVPSSLASNGLCLLLACPSAGWGGVGRGGEEPVVPSASACSGDCRGAGSSHFPSL